jgi:ParB family transcriptional regulator, chromosome partitioning protein
MSTSPVSDGGSPLALVELEIGQIEPNANNPRLIFPQEQLDRLADSIDQEGILVPITVFQRDDHYVLVDGERRFRCATILGLRTVPALIVPEKADLDVLVQMFNIHLVREPWKDIPTARAVGKLADDLRKTKGKEPSDQEIRDITGLSLERVKRFRYVLTLPAQWQDYINDDTIPLNFFWELKRNVIDPLAVQKPQLVSELGGEDAVASAFVEKRLDGVITDTVGLRKVRPIINYATQDAEDGGESVLDETIRELVNNPERSIDDAYEDTVQIMVEADKLESRTKAMIVSFERLLAKARTTEDTVYIKRIGENFIQRLAPLVQSGEEPR